VEQLALIDMSKQKSTDYRWTFKDYEKVVKHNKKVFSCFACGGGSTMGYKLAGYDVIGCCEIDKKMNELYVLNHNPKHNYLMDIRDFNKIPNGELPKELFDLDILDGSPPCTTFSMAGQREETWGKKKKFREGQTEQTLDDLSFVFIDTVEKLQPKVVIMENVEGLLKGEAWSYVQKIYKQFKDIGYEVKHYLLKGEEMGVPQTRHRVFFIANRMGYSYDKLPLVFDYEPIKYKEIYDGQGRSVAKGSKTEKLLNELKYGEKDLGAAHERLYGNVSFFQNKILYDDEVVPTIRAKSCDFYAYGTHKGISQNEIILSQTFPQDYNFGSKTLSNVSYVCGMSVPPIMIKRVATQIYENWLR